MSYVRTNNINHIGILSGENKGANLDRRSSYVKRNNFDGPDRCNENGCHRSSSNRPVNVVAIAVITPVCVAILLFGLFFGCWLYGGMHTSSKIL